MEEVGFPVVSVVIENVSEGQSHLLLIEQSKFLVDVDHLLSTS